MMIEQKLYNFINKKFDAFLELPAGNKKKRFILLEKVGASSRQGIESATFAVQSHAESLYESAKLNNAVKKYLLEDFYNEPEICSVSLDSDYQFNDHAKKEYRYQAIIDIDFYN